MVVNILELAYIKDPKLFDRDANTRRSAARASLKAETGMRDFISIHQYISSLFFAGWGDEQIEGWRIMLERNVCLSCYPLYHPLTWTIYSAS